MTTRFRGCAAGLCAFAVLAGAGPASAQSAADFYKGKTVTVLVGSDVGGGYDLTARTLAHYLGLTPKWVDGTAVGGCSFMIQRQRIDPPTVRRVDESGEGAGARVASGLQEGEPRARASALPRARCSRASPA